MALEPFVGSVGSEPSTGRQKDSVAVEGQRAFTAPPQASTPAAAATGAQPIDSQPQTPAAQPAETVDPATLLAQIQSPQAPAQPIEQTPETPQQDGAQPASKESVEASPKGDDDKEGMRETLKQLVLEEFGTDLDALRANQEKQRLQQEAQQLQSIWNVSGAEMSRRLGVLGQAINQLPEESRQAFTSPAALNILWTAVQAQGTDRAPEWNSSPSTVPAATSLSQAEIDSMSPEEYSRRQPEILAFYRSRV